MDQASPRPSATRRAAPARPLRVAVLSSEQPAHACHALRIAGPLGWLEGALEVRDALAWGRDGARFLSEPVEAADVLVLQRGFPSPQTAELIGLLRGLGKPIVYETDDLLHELPEDNPCHRVLAPLAPHIVDALRRADAVTVATGELARRVAGLNGRVHVVENQLDPRVWPVPAPRAEGGPVVIGYAGTDSHLPDLRLVEGVLVELAERWGERVAFAFLGCATERLRALPRLAFVRFEPSYRAYARALGAAGIDVGVVPLRDTPFNRAKSDVKWLEYAACGITGVFSDVLPYAGVRDGVDGLRVADDPRAWREALDGLVADAGRRRALAAAAAERVRTGRTVAASAERLLAIYEEALAVRRPRPAAAPAPAAAAVPDAAARRRPSVLLVTHDFPPHNFGGVEVHALRLAHGLQALGCAVSVFHPLREPAPACRVDRTRYEGIDVHRLAAPALTPLTPFVEPGREAAFRAFLAQGRFDVVHFHHTVLMPMSLVRVAREAGAAVALTLHDFWLLCAQTHLFDPGANAVCAGPEPERCGRCLAGPAWETLDPARRAGLLELGRLRRAAAADALDAAHLVAAPSRFVADTFARAGQGRGEIRIAPLGLPPLPRAERPAGPRPLTLGYLGTIHALKGIGRLVEAVARVKGDLRLVVHGGGAPRDVDALRRLVKDPRVTLAGPYRPEDLPRLLAGVDAVVVPSRIESYCFTAREALASGVPVIAARVGGIPEAVVHGRNGYLYEPEDAGALAALLQAIVDDPAALARLAPGPAAPTTAEDAEGWLRRYQALLGWSDAPGEARAAAAVPGVEGDAHRTAFLLEPDGGAWERVVESFLTSFGADDPVALVVVLDPASPHALPEHAAGERLLAVAARLGLERFPELRVVGSHELAGELTGFAEARWAPACPPVRHAGGAPAGGTAGWWPRPTGDTMRASADRAGARKPGCRTEDG